MDRTSLAEQVEHDESIRRQARDHISALDVPGTPDLRPSRVLQIMGLPEWCGTRQVHRIDITPGEPMNGIARSVDHIGYFEIDLPFEEILWEEVRGTKPPEGSWLESHGWQDVCHECGSARAIYVYSANHFITGYERVYCPECQTEYAREDWG